MTRGELLVDSLGTGIRRFYDQAADGSPIAVTDDNGMVEGYAYSAFGEVTVIGPDGSTLPRSTFGNRHLFQGQLYDPLTETYFMRARQYRPKWGRFLSKDPIDLAGGPNRYAFVDGSPLTTVDPFGLDPCYETVGGILDCGPGATGTPTPYTAEPRTYHVVERILGDGDSRGLDAYAMRELSGGRYQYADRELGEGRDRGSGRSSDGTIMGFPADRVLAQRDPFRHCYDDGTCTTTVPLLLLPAPGVVEGAADAISKVTGWVIRTVAKIVGPRSPSVPKRMLQAFQRQLEKDGENSLRSSLESIERNLLQHQAKLDAARASGGYTSSLEREIWTFERQIEAIRYLLGGR